MGLKSPSASANRRMAPFSTSLRVGGEDLPIAFLSSMSFLSTCPPATPARRAALPPPPTGVALRYPRDYPCPGPTPGRAGMRGFRKAAGSDLLPVHQLRKLLFCDSDADLPLQRVAARAGIHDAAGAHPPDGTARLADGGHQPIQDKSRIHSGTQ